MTVRETLGPYLELARPADVIIGIIGLLAAAFVASGTSFPDHLTECAIVTVAVILYIIGGNSINDSVDAEVDGVAHPDRPVPSGRISSASAFRFGLSSLAIAFLLSLVTTDVTVITIVGIACVAITLYETVLKKKGFVGNVTIAALTGMSFLLGGAMVHNMAACGVLAATVFTVTLGREIQKDILDRDGDSACRNTLPMRIGTERADIAARLSYAAAVCVSLLPFIFGDMGILYITIVAADAMLLAAASGRFGTAGSERIAKYSTLAVMAASVLGIVHL
ncbi:MAG: UbiA family prenyltransferase [Candidatus Methanomethylophilaceae archaeon]